MEYHRLRYEIKSQLQLQIISGHQIHVFSSSFSTLQAFLQVINSVGERPFWADFPDLSVTLRGAPSEETLDAAELEMECRE